MPISELRLTTKEFSEKAGVSPSTVSAWLKKGKIKGEKKGAKWLIAEGELKKVNAPKPAKTKPASKKKKAAAKATKQNPSIPNSKPAAPSRKGFISDKSYTVEAFAEMTYLTVYGVKKWLKEGRLIGGVDASGQQCVDAASLDHAHVKRLLR